jgi:16S rRNA (adenine1518-N6/adenine1519-N6)-dimethyltransferase
MKRTPKLGQHFLTGLWAAKKLAESVAVREGETILEIGPGKGALTRELLKCGARVVAVEKDEALVRQLQQTFTNELEAGKLTLLEEDIRNVTPQTLGLSRYVLAANIPYYITGEIIRTFLEARPQPRALALLVQKEVAERIVARDGKESILSLSVKAFGTPRVVAKVPRGNFSPPPSVDSAILLIDSVSRNFFADLDEQIFFRVVRAGFSSKRKLLANNLSTLYAKGEVLHALKECGVGEKARAEDVSLSQWKQLAHYLSGRGSQ